MAKSWENKIDLGTVLSGQHKGAARGLLAGMEHVLQVSNTEVPIEEGALERSGVASVDEANLRGAVSYDTPYAVVQHEDMNAHHDAGRRAKFLERAFASERDAVAKIIAQEIKRSLGTS